METDSAKENKLDEVKGFSICSGLENSNIMETEHTNNAKVRDEVDLSPCCSLENSSISLFFRLIL